MKGINLKKIGAIVAGTAILASSVAFAGVFYQNTEVVNDDGQPLAKVIIGEMGSDGVAGAWIASNLANNAYKGATLTAEVVGEATCNGGAGGEGTCEVIAGSESCTLEITVPGAGLEGRHDFDTAIGDYIDRELLNRWTNATDSDESYTVLTDYDDIDANPFQDTEGNYIQNGAGGSQVDDLVGNDEVELYKIGADRLPGPFGNVDVKDARSGKEWLEEQAWWVHGKTRWDQGDNELYGNVEFSAYTAVFDPGGDYGIPLCPGDEGVDYDACADTDRINAHKVFIKFMNEDWVISDVDPSNTPAYAVDDGQTYSTKSSSLKLAKEAISGIINVGEILDTGTGYKVRLDDISREVGAGNAHPAIITVLDANDNEICQDQVNPGETKDDLCEEPTGVKLHVYQTAPGLNFIAKWAEMAVYSDEIELESEEHFLDDDDTEWYAVIGWSDEGDDVTSITPEYLRTIILYNPEEQDEMDAGDKYPVVDVEEYEKFDLTYNGIDDEGVDYDSLDIRNKEDRTYTIQTPNHGNTTCTLEVDHLLEVKSSSAEFRTDLATFGGNAVSHRGPRLDIIYNSTEVTGGTCINAAVHVPTYVPESGDILLKDKDGEYWLYQYTAVRNFDYRWAGSDGKIYFYNVTDATRSAAFGNTQGEVYLVENAGKWDDPTTCDDITDSLGTWLQGTGAIVDLMSVSATEDKDETTLNVQCEGQAPYTDLFFDDFGYTNNESYEEPFISMRGTKFTGGDTDSKKYKVPKQQLFASYTFETAEAAETAADTNKYVLGEGEETDVGTTGVHVKVVSIDQQLSPCTFAGAGDAVCTPDMSTVSAVIMPNNAPSVETSVPYKLTSNLVMKDSEATGLDTGVVITVGGDKANTVTADAVAGTDIDFEATPVVVRVIGNKIVVAGLYEEDTLTAADQFVGGLTRS